MSRIIFVMVVFYFLNDHHIILDTSILWIKY